MPLYRRPGSPYWWVRIGRKTRKSTGTTNRKDAEEYERVLQQRLWRLEKLGDRSALSWEEAVDRWLVESTHGRIRERELARWLSPKLDGQPVSAVADPDVYAHLQKLGLAFGWKHATVNRMMCVVRAVLRACVRWRHLEHVPPVPMYPERLPEPRWLTQEEFQRLYQALPAHLALATHFAVLTGLRMRSMLALTWDRIDLKAKVAWIPSAQMKAGRAHGIPLSGEAIKVLQRLRTLNPRGAHVFQWKGKPVGTCHTIYFKRAVRRCGLAPFRWHDLRHTWASWAVQAGVPLQQVMELGGWKSYSMVLRYSHLAPSHLAAAAELVAQRAHTAAHRKRARST